MAALSTVFTVVISMYAAYAIARIRFVGQPGCSGSLLLVTQMFPHILLVIPLYPHASSGMGLFNTHAALVIAYTSFSLPFTIWLLRGFLRGDPARAGGAGRRDRRRIPC